MVDDRMPHFPNLRTDFRRVAEQALTEAERLAERGDWGERGDDGAVMPLSSWLGHVGYEFGQVSLGMIDVMAHPDSGYQVQSLRPALLSLIAQAMGMVVAVDLKTDPEWATREDAKRG